MGQLFNRVLTAPGGQMPVVSRQGMGLVGAMLDPLLVATDAAITLTVADIARGAIMYTGFSAGRVLTTPTAALILAAAPDMDIGDTFTFFVSIQDAFAGTWAAGVGVTLAGYATTVASGKSMIVVRKDSATAVTWFVL